ncbi:hypothetical protein BU17DRAFT_67787 [Hysterangium stoloniferum]|nr:hypothetical protein BU17DRAFT_67787 [Hysterangium stoloniferum]
MFEDEDYTNGLREKLARVFSKGMDDLKEPAIQKLSASSPVFPLFTPQIYTSCMLYAELSTQGHLTFTGKLDFTNCDHSLFSASLTIPSSAESMLVLVKLVSGKYGEAVHHLSAQHDLAPALRAFFALRGHTPWTIFRLRLGKTLLDDSSLSHSHICSLDKPRHSQSSRHSQKERQGPHGDLCDAGNVYYYPALRNGNIAWPGKSAGPIEGDHDRLSHEHSQDQPGDVDRDRVNPGYFSWNWQQFRKHWWQACIVDRSMKNISPCMIASIVKWRERLHMSLAVRKFAVLNVADGSAEAQTFWSGMSTG